MAGLYRAETKATRRHLCLVAATTGGLVCCAVQCCEAREQTGGEVEAEGKDRGDINGEPLQQLSSMAPRSDEERDSIPVSDEKHREQKDILFLFCLFSPTSTATSINTCTKGVLKSNKGTIRMITTKNGIICQLSVSFFCFFSPPEMLQPVQGDVLGDCVPQTCIATANRNRSRKNRSRAKTVCQRERGRGREIVKETKPQKNRFTKF